MRMLKRTVAFIMAVVMMATMTPISVEAATKKKDTVKSVTIKKPDTKTLVMKKGDTYKLKTKVKVSGKVSKKVTYASSNKKVATIDKNGKIKAVQKGTAKITVKSVANSKKKASIKVLVGTPVAKVKLNKKKATAYVGDTIKLKATVSPKKASVGKVKFTTNNDTVAKVDGKGVVSCVGEGKAKITAVAADGNGKKATFSVTVKANATTSEQANTTESTTTDSTTAETVEKTEKTTAENKDSDDKKEEKPTTPEDLNAYQLVWADEFEGNELNRNDWNVELHQPGWVNEELQEYVDSEENIYLEDGKLVIKPIKTENQDGSFSYTSGRISTQNKNTFTYGKFEARAKIPEGKGYLPAFWLMANDENVYGQWPRCGEIDIMEVHGSDTDTLYGTIHYGNPQKQRQGTYDLSDGSFADDYHTFTCEWEPGKITWYVDGIKYHETSDWYSATEGQGEIAYPAPFDQPFYIILNLAVGGSWIGNPDETTDFDHAKYEVDYVRVYQREHYDENVTKPEVMVELRDPDENGNYVNNGDFADAEDLTDDNDWKFLEALGGKADANIADQALTIRTTDAGTVDYSVQLVQAGIPMEKGATYVLQFDAQASEERTMKVDISAPDNGYIRYFGDETINLTEEKHTYEFPFTMKSDSDANGRLEFNLGHMGSVADVVISNVSIKKTGVDDSVFEEPDKTILADGNHIYNGSFQEGANRLKYWTVSEGANVSVTNLANGRRLKVVIPQGGKNVTISQEDLAFTIDKEYQLSFDAEAGAGQEIVIVAAGSEYVWESGAKMKHIFTTQETLPNKNFSITFKGAGIYYVDNICVVENALIKNGSFSAGFASFETFVDGSASATYVVDSLSEDNAADFSIADTGDQDWKIQLKQGNVELEQGKWYQLSLQAKSSIGRKIRIVLQRDGSVHSTTDEHGVKSEDWTVYASDTVELTSEYETYHIPFQMTRETDLGTIFNVAMGAVDGEQITTSHRVCIDNISLVEIDPIGVPEQEIGTELLKNKTFANNGEGWENTASVDNATVTFSDNQVVYDVKNVGAADYSIQLKQIGFELENGAVYQLKFNANSTQSRVIKAAIMDGSYDWFGGEDISLEENITKPVTVEFVAKRDEFNAGLYISMGLVGEVTPLSTITLSDFSLVKVADSAN